jgi:Fe-S-cluster-containing hydrogenase component 2
MTEPKVKINIDYRKCNPKRCEKGICKAISVCPNKLIKQIGPFDFPYPIDGFCKECGKCQDACLLEAIHLM